MYLEEPVNSTLTSLVAFPCVFKRTMSSSAKHAYDTLMYTTEHDSTLKSIAKHRRSAVAEEAGCHTMAESHDHCRRKYSFIDIPSTGMRLAYRHYGGSGNKRTKDRVILLLHGAGMSSAVWDSVGSELGRAGYGVFALDLRGHGRSTHSAIYTCDAMMADVHGFIIEKDLYTKPVCVIGMGMGGIIALALASSSPKLVGAVGMVEIGVVLEPYHESECQNDINQAGEEKLLLNDQQPWVCRWLGQERRMFDSVQVLALWLRSPLSSVGPRLARYCFERQMNVQDDPYFVEWMERATGVDGQCLHVAHELVRESTSMHGGGYEQRMDACFEFSFRIGSVIEALKCLQVHSLFIFGEYSTMISRQDVCSLSSMCTSAASVTVEEIAGRSSTFVRDDPDGTCDLILDYLEDVAMHCFDVPKGDAWSRTPANLGLRPLPEYSSLEEAAKALGPRRIPTKEDIEDELRKLRVDAGKDADDVTDDDEGYYGSIQSGSRTALSHDPMDYFGFVG